MGNQLAGQLKVQQSTEAGTDFGNTMGKYSGNSNEDTVNIGGLVDSRGVDHRKNTEQRVDDSLMDM